MYAIAFDLTVAVAEALHPRGSQAAYPEIGRVLRRYGFRRVQGSVYVTDDEDMSKVTDAMLDLRALPWFPVTVRDIRAFRVQQWSDYTPFMKKAASAP